jgi:outer membrane protein assembly factor BamB
MLAFLISIYKRRQGKKEDMMKNKIYFIAFIFFLTVIFSPLHTQLDAGPWPMFHGNEMHTGQSLNQGSVSGVLAWSYYAGTFELSSPVIGEDEKAYLGVVNAVVYNLNSDGSLLWSYRTGVGAGDGVRSAPAVDSDGRVYAISDDGNTYGLLSDGSMLWSYDRASGYTYSSPAIGSDGRVYVGAKGTSTNIYSLNSSGSLLWSYNMGGGDSSAAIGSDGTVYVGSNDDRIYALNSIGSLLWSYTTGSSVFASPAIDNVGRVFVGSRDNNAYALLSDGSLLWSYATGSSILSSSAVGSVLVGSNDNNIYSLSSTGSFKWSFAAGDDFTSSPALGSDGTAYVGALDDNVYGLLSDGSLLWSYRTGDDVYSSPAIGSNGRIYVGSDDFNLYVFEGPPTPTPTATPTATPPPQAEIILNGSSFSRGDQFTATFQLNESITRPFTAYAVVILPNNSMLNALTLDTPLTPVATNVPGLAVPDGPFTFPLINTAIPGGAPLGVYEVVAAFFDPARPITSRTDAFLEASGPFTIQ